MSFPSSFPSRTAFAPWVLAALAACGVVQAAEPPADSVAPPAFAGASLPDGPPLDLQQALALALDGNPGLRAARQALAATEGAVLQSQARPNPELAWSQEDTRRSTRTLTVQLNQTLEVGGKREARMRVAERGRDLARAELAGAEAALRADVGAAFFGVLAAQQRVVLAGQTLE
ncbi:TolC family protein, partial [Delftia tsuruhatensis]